MQLLHNGRYKNEVMNLPPKARYTREEIVDVACGLVRRYGESFLSARSLASELGTSTAPIFTAFGSIEELQAEVVNRAKKLYKEYLDEGLASTPAFKGAGLQYIKFAKDEPEFFKMLFMKDGGNDLPSHYFPAGDENEPLVREAVQGAYGFDTERAKKIYNHLAVYAHGLAVLYAQGKCVFTDEDVSRMLSELFMSLTKGERL